MTLSEIIITMIVLMLIFLIVYMKMQNKNLLETISELREIIKGEKK